MTEPFDERDKRQLDMQLEKELEDTFPASDPPTVTRFPRRRHGADKPPTGGEAGRRASGGRRQVRTA
jgi:hypothetical protein